MMYTPTKPNSQNYYADFSKQFLVFGVGIVIVFFEIALAKWPFFFSATPMLSLCYIFNLVLLRPQLMPAASILLIALLFELMGGDMLGVRLTSFYIATLFIRRRVAVNEEVDFIAQWANFTLICFSIVLFRLLVFSLLYFVMPNLSMLAFQIGISILVFPIFFVSMNLVFSILGSPINQDN